MCELTVLCAFSCEEKWWCELSRPEYLADEINELENTVHITTLNLGLSAHELLANYVGVFPNTLPARTSSSLSRYRSISSLPQGVLNVLFTDRQLLWCTSLSFLRGFCCCYLSLRQESSPFYRLKDNQIVEVTSLISSGRSTGFVGILSFKK